MVSIPPSSLAAYFIIDILLLSMRGCRDGHRFHGGVELPYTQLSLHPIVHPHASTYLKTNIKRPFQQANIEFFFIDWMTCELIYNLFMKLGDREGELEMGKGLLEVVLIAAEGLQDTHDDSAYEKESYVMVQYMGQKLKSKVSHGMYEFQVKNARAAKHRQKVIFKIKAGDDLVGEAIVNVADAITLGLEEGVCEQPVCKYSVVLADQTSHGEIRVAVKFTANGLQDMRFGFKSFSKTFLSTLACSMPV